MKPSKKILLEKHQNRKKEEKEGDTGYGSPEYTDSKAIALY